MKKKELIEKIAKESKAAKSVSDTSFARTYKALKIAKIMFYPQDVR